MNNFPLMAARIFNRPHLIHPGKAEVILTVLQERLGVQLQPSQPEVALPDFRKRAMRSTYIDRGIGVVDIDGTLVHKGAWIGADSGLVSYEGISQQVRMLSESAEVRAILLNIESPGGEAAGCFDCSLDLPELADGKPLFAIAADYATSGAYAIGAGAEEFAVTQSGVVGSIGVVLTHMDRTGEAEQKGIKVTHIHAGAEKVVGSPFKPLSEGDQKKLQAEVNELYDLFVALVADARDLSEDAVRGTEAGVFRGNRAVEVGLADRVISVREYLDELASKFSTINRSSRMDGANTKTPAITRELVASEAPEVAEQLRQEGREAGATQERERIQSVLGQSMSGHEALINELAFDGKTTGPEAAVQVLQAERQAVAKRKDQIEADGAEAEVETTPVAPEKPATIDPDLPVEDRCKIEWDRDRDLRAEFGNDLDAYVEYTRAAEDGRARIKGGK